MKKAVKGILLLAGWSLLGITNIYAQKNIEHVIEKSKIIGGTFKILNYHPHKDSKEVVEAIQIEITDNKELLDEFIEAFKKDRPNAYTVFQKIKDKKISSETFIFREDSTIITYSCLFKEGDSADIIRTRRPENKPVKEVVNAIAEKPTYYISTGTKFSINGKEMSVEEARAQGYNVNILPEE